MGVSIGVSKTHTHTRRDMNRAEKALSTKKNDNNIDIWHVYHHPDHQKCNGQMDNTIQYT